MARRQRNRSALAGLAALGALGYISGKGPLGGLYKRREGAPAPVEDRSTGSSRDAFDYNAVADRQNAEFGGRQDGGGMPLPENDAPQGARILTPAEREGMRISEGERVAQEAALRGDTARMMDAGHFNRARPAGSAGPARPDYNAIAARQNAELRARQAAAAGPAAGAAAGPAAARAPINDREHVFSGPMGPVGSVSQARALINNRDQVFDPRAHGPLTREEAIASIPGQSARAPQGGQRVSGNEVTRNLSNIAMGLGPTRLAGFGNAAVEGATARAAAQRAAVLRAERAEAARRGQTPTTFTSTRPNDATKRTRKFNEEDSGVEFKRGGKTKKMASGGMTSASKRGDGIASKGKTKCKMY